MISLRPSTPGEENTTYPEFGATVCTIIDNPGAELPEDVEDGTTEGDKEEGSSLAVDRSSVVQGSEENQGETGEDALSVVFTEEDGSGLVSDFDVVLDILVGVDGVVEDSPAGHAKTHLSTKPTTRR